MTEPSTEWIVENFTPEQVEDIERVKRENIEDDAEERISIENCEVI